MSYSPFTWVNGTSGGTPVTATRLNALEQGVAAAVAKGDLVFNVKDYGAAGDGAADDSSEIQAAISAASAVGGGTVFFPAGTYRIGTRIDLASNVKLQGGSGGAVIDFSTTATTGSSRIGMRALGSVGSALSLSANGSKGSYSVTLTAVTGLAVGDWVRLSSGADFPYDANLKRGEIKQIRDITGTTVTFEQALYDNYATADTSVVAKVTFVQNIEIANLTFRGADTPGDSNRALTLEFVNEFSVHHCKFLDADTYGVYVRSSIRGDVSKNIFRGVYYDGTTGTIFYAILLSSAAQWARVEGNLGERVRHLVTVSAASNDPGCPRHCTVVGNIAQNMQGGAGGRSWAYECHGVGENILFTGNVADSCYGGFVTRGPGVSFVGNTVRNWYAYALHIHPDIEDARDILIQGNVVQDRTIEGGGFATPAAIRAELTNATVVRNLVIDGNVVTQDATGQPAIKVDGSTVTAESLVLKGNVIMHASASVPSISCTVKGAVRRGNIVNGAVEGGDSLEAFASSPVSTMPRQFLGSSAGTVSSGQILGGRALVTRGGTYSKVRFCTGTTAPAGLTDFRGGVWDSAGALLAATGNESAAVAAASTVYELSLSSPVTLDAQQEVYIGFAVLGTTPGTYRGIASFSGINDLSPAISKTRTGWSGGTVLALTAATSAVPWIELVA